MRQSKSATTSAAAGAASFASLKASSPALESDELDLITRDAAAETGALTGLLVVRNTADDHLDVLCAWGTAPSEDRPSLPAARSGFVGRVLQSGCAVGEPISDLDDALLAISASGAHAQYAVGAPVRPPRHPSGALCLGLPRQPPDPDTTLWFVESFARVAALALHDSRSLASILTAARRDPLTGCLNYAAIRSELERETFRSTRYRRPLSCSFIDLDRFKLVNDERGHLYGSRVLADVANRLRDEVRVSDSVGRYGGDEFVVLLPDTDEAAARALAERLRARICTTTERGREPLDASIGVAQWHPGTTADELLAAADDALQCAKQLGGGTVVGAGEVAARASRGVAGAVGGAASFPLRGGSPRLPHRDSPR